MDCVRTTLYWLCFKFGTLIVAVHTFILNCFIWISAAVLPFQIHIARSVDLKQSFLFQAFNWLRFVVVSSSCCCDSVFGCTRPDLCVVLKRHWRYCCALHNLRNCVHPKKKESKTERWVWDWFTVNKIIIYHMFPAVVGRIQIRKRKFGGRPPLEWIYDVPCSQKGYNNQEVS